MTPIATLTGRTRTGPARCAALSPDGGAVLVVRAGGVTLLSPSGAPVWSSPLDVPGEDDVAVAWSATRPELFVLAGRRLSGFHPETGAPLPPPAALDGVTDLTAVAFDATGVRLATGTHSGAVAVTDRGDGTTLQLPVGGRVRALAWGPRDPELCVAVERNLQFWSLGTGSLLYSVPFQGIIGVTGLAWSPDGVLLAVAGAADVFTVDVRGRRGLDLLRVDGRPGRPVTLAFSRSGTHLLVGFTEAVVIVDRQLRQAGTLPVRLAEPGDLHVGATGALLGRENAELVACWRLPDTEDAPAADRDGTAIRHWARRAARSVGRDHGAGGAAVLAVRVRTLVTDGPGRWGPGFGWTPRGDGRCYQDVGGALIRTEAGGAVRWRRPLPRPGGALDIEPAGGDAEPLAALGFRNDGPDGTVLVVDTDTGEVTATVPGGQSPAWSPRGDRLAVTAPGPRPAAVHVHRVADLGTDRPPVRLAAAEGVGRIAWSPDGTRLAAASRGRVVLWDVELRRRVAGPPSAGERTVFGPVAWSPDGKRLAALSVGEHAELFLWDTGTWRLRREPSAPGEPGWAPALAWSPDSATLAYPSAAPGSVELYDVASGRIVRSLPPQERNEHVWAIRWSPVAGELVTTYRGGCVRHWRLLAGDPDAPPRTPFDTDVLARLGVTVAAAGAALPLSRPADVLALLAGKAPPPLARLAGHPGVRALQALHWPVDGLIGVVTLLVCDLGADPGFPLPPEIRPAAMLSALTEALAAPPVPADPDAGDADALSAIFDRVDDDVLTILTLLGPAAVAAEPLLPAQLRGLRGGGGWILSAPQRKLIGLRLSTAAARQAEGGGLGERAGLARHGPITALLPTQLAVPELLGLRASRGELLFRTRRGGVPPTSRTTVVVFDDTPAACGQVGTTLRSAAHVLAGAVLGGGQRCLLVPLGEPALAVPVLESADLSLLWLESSLRPGDVPAALEIAERAADEHPDDLGGTARIVVFTHEHRKLPDRDHWVVRVRYPHSGPAVPGARVVSLVCGAGPDEIRTAVATVLGAAR
ncbi:WD40 repeat domain-containing protein [Amycolatopsis vastitatis]|uniref:Uncharacterized protein n=1 Tax=Amycolatopsis vastitatis TaxID=1905142 RepID=A0A229TBY2_9PSEU|nr:WD40 repeat domain-containing protein [Amycolatopsis vastitatis]OXM68678.1 hypothetical protein CF165_11340 [Amycolatopsis vastitatis]